MGKLRNTLDWCRYFFFFEWIAPIWGSDELPDEESADLRDTWQILKVFRVFLFYGWLCICFLGFEWDFLIGLLWSLSGLAFGFLGGFLFGIPKVIQHQDRELGAITDKPESYQQLVNTNLVEISDWLTKIIVGLGLIQLKEIPAFVRKVAHQFSSSFIELDVRVGTCAAILVFFTISGFLLGYLLTRLYIQKALLRAEHPNKTPRPKASIKKTQKDRVQHQSSGNPSQPEATAD
ncbi:MAG: hypothetical protein QM811_16770 [Pirellulales bacterium]